ncbi:MAG: hypothetical protein WC718_15305, partial [Phycisphaerales bacterium]
MFQLISVLGVFTVAILLGIMEPKTRGDILPVAAGVGALTVVAIGVLVWDWRRPDRQPDLLRKAVGSYFDHNGFCFRPLPGVRDGLCMFAVYFQNQFEKDCKA